MSKKIVELERDASQWKCRCEKSHAALLEMAIDKRSRDAELETLNKKYSKLQALCQIFQQERANLMRQLKTRVDLEGGQSTPEGTIRENSTALNCMPLKRNPESKTGDNETHGCQSIVKSNSTGAVGKLTNVPDEIF